MSNKISVALSTLLLASALTLRAALAQQAADHGGHTGRSSAGHELLPATAALGEAPRGLPPSFYGFNVNLINSGTSWSNVHLIRAAQDLCPANLRYPGGTLANYWDWRSGALLKHPGAPRWSRGTPMPYRLEDLKLALDATAAQPILVVNMLTSTLDEQLAMLRHATRLGFSARYVELGNEFYLSEDTYISRFPTAEDYGLEATRWIDRIKKDFPKTEVAAVGAYSTAGQSERRATWNRRLLTTLRGADAIVLHVYVGSGLGPSLKSLTQTRLAGRDSASNPWYAAPDIQRQQLQALRTPAGAAAVLSMPFRADQQLRREIQDLPGLRVWVTEYNLFDRVGPTKGTWAHGLLTATMLGLFLENPRVELSCCHVIGSPLTSFATLFMNEDPFRDCVVSRKTTPYTPTAAGIALRAMGRAMHAMKSYQKIDFGSDRPLSAPALPMRPLVGWRFADGRHTRDILLNLSHNDVQLDGRGLHFTDSSFEQMSAAPDDLIVSVHDLRQTRGKASDTLTLPPYSLTCIGETSEPP